MTMTGVMHMVADLGQRLLNFDFYLEKIRYAGRKDGCLACGTSFVFAIAWLAADSSTCTSDECVSASALLLSGRIGTCNVHNLFRHEIVRRESPPSAAGTCSARVACTVTRAGREPTA